MNELTYVACCQRKGNHFRLYCRLRLTLQTLLLTDATAKDALLFSSPQSDGSWIELVKTKNDDFNPGSPTIRIDVTDHSPNAMLGVQGFLQNTQDPAADSLQVWLEVLNSPDLVAANTTYSLSYTISATAVPEPTSLFFLAGCVAFAAVRHRPRRFALSDCSNAQ
ncbi:MAG: hypothetical protein KDB00_03060 [Planctomycetales bacterium]|nr:hypothetical protein [Planctomycetales bacterium]